jgi:serine palmitoyltransferase
MDLPPSLRDGSEGRMRLQRLAFNSRYLGADLPNLGSSSMATPIRPLCHCCCSIWANWRLFHRMMRARKIPIAVVVVSYPATPLITSRVRFSVSASHTKDDIDTILRACDEIGDILDLEAPTW